LLRTAWRLLLTLIILAITLAMLHAFLGAAFAAALGLCSKALGWLGGVLGLALIVAFGVGVLVRMARGFHGAAVDSMRNSRGGRPRVSSRRRAEGIPAHGHRSRSDEGSDPELEV